LAGGLGEGLMVCSGFLIDCWTIVGSTVDGLNKNVTQKPLGMKFKTPNLPSPPHNVDLPKKYAKDCQHLFHVPQSWPFIFTVSIPFQIS
jgi:hypothetical protein